MKNYKNIAPVTTDPRVSALTKVVAFKSYRYKYISYELIKIQLHIIDQTSA